MMEKDIFDWRWEDEVPENEYQLVIERVNEYVKIYLRNGQFVQMGKSGEYVQDQKYFLKERFIHWYNRADSLDIEPFLNQNLVYHKDHEEVFIRSVRAIIKAMPHINEWEPNFEGKQQIGLDWADEQLEELARKKQTIKKKSQPKIQVWTFENIFYARKLSGDKLLEKLRGTYIDDKNNWLREIHDFKGLVFFLEGNDLVRIDKYKTIRDVLLKRINFKTYAHPERSPKKDSIDQFKFLLEK